MLRGVLKFNNNDGMVIKFTISQWKTLGGVYCLHPIQGLRGVRYEENDAYHSEYLYISFVGDIDLFVSVIPNNNCRLLRIQVNLCLSTLLQFGKKISQLISPALHPSTFTQNFLFCGTPSVDACIFNHYV